MMKRKYVKVSMLLSIAITAFLLMSSNGEQFRIHKYHGVILKQAGSDPSKTGAPGEGSCVNCHSGSAQDGNLGINELTLDNGGTDYDPSITNPMTLTLNDASSKNGFQLVALDENDDMAGSFSLSDATNTQIVSNSQLNRDYVTHTVSGNGESSWTFDWEAPSGVGDVTFYVATNKTNSSGSSSGDVIYLSSHTFNNPQLSLQEEDKSKDIQVGYIPSENSLLLDFEVEKSSDVSLNVIDLSGKSVYFNNEGRFQGGDYSEKVRLPETVKNGIYVVTIFIGNRPHSKKVMIQK